MAKRLKCNQNNYIIALFRNKKRLDVSQALTKQTNNGTKIALSYIRSVGVITEFTYILSPLA
jgi:hypothetical protein